MPTGRCHCARSPARKSKSEEVGERKEKKKKRKMRKEGRAAAGRLKPYLKMGSDIHSDVALPVTFVSPRYRSFMPTGRCHCARSPARKSMRTR